MMASLGYVVEKVRNLDNIYLLYCTVGHTHNELDGHFGTMTTNVLPKRDLFTPQGLFSDDNFEKKVLRRSPRGSGDSVRLLSFFR